MTKSNLLLWLVLLALVLAVSFQAFEIKQLSQQLRYLGNTGKLSQADSGIVNPRVADANDLDKILALKNEGKYAEALDEHIWFHTASRNSPPLAGVRVSFALNYWIELGKVYPPALDALKDLKDQYREKVMTGQSDFNDLLDLFGIHRVLSDAETTIDDYRLLYEKYPDKAEQVFLFVEDILVDNKHYDLLAKLIPDPMVKLETLRSQRESSLAYAPSSDHSDLMVQQAEEEYIKGVTRLVETLIALDKTDQANLVKEKAMEYNPSASIAELLN